MKYYGYLWETNKDSYVYRLNIPLARACGELFEIEYALGSPETKEKDIYTINGNEYYISERFTNFDTKEIIYVLKKPSYGLH